MGRFNRYEFASSLGLLCASLSLLTACARDGSADAPMTAVFFEVEGEAPIEAAVQPLAEADGPPPSIPAASASEDRGAGGAGGPGRLFRGSRDVPGGEWDATWSVDLDPGDPANAVHAAGERVLVESDSSWTLLDAKGQRLAHGLHAEAPLTVSEALGAFYYTTSDGFVAIASLSDGNETGLAEAYFGEGYGRSVVRSEENELWVHSTELEQLDSEARVPEFSIFERLRVGGGGRPDEDGILEVARAASVMSRVRPLHVARSGASLFVATPSELYRLGSSFEIERRWSGLASASALAVDEAGRSYVVGSDPARGAHIARISADGVVELRFAAPERFAPASPPRFAVGHDHRVFWAGRQTIAAFEPDGTHAWTAALGGGIVGLLVAPSGHVIVAAGSSLQRVAPDGSVATMHALESGSWRAGPVSTARGELIAATATALHCLSQSR